MWRDAARHRLHRPPLKCRSLHEFAHSSTRSSPISPPATPNASTAPTHRRCTPRKPNSRPPLLRPCPECARGCTTAPLRLASRALRSPVPFLTCLHVCRPEIASPRPRFVCSRTDVEPDNDHTDTPATIAIDALFFLSSPSRNVRGGVPAAERSIERRCPDARFVCTAGEVRAGTGQTRSRRTNRGLSPLESRAALEHSGSRRADRSILQRRTTVGFLHSVRGGPPRRWKAQLMTFPLRRAAASRSSLYGRPALQRGFDAERRDLSHTTGRLSRAPSAEPCCGTSVPSGGPFDFRYRRWIMVIPIILGRSRSRNPRLLHRTQDGPVPGKRDLLRGRGRG